jgi:hypothetical protein
MTYSEVWGTLEQGWCGPDDDIWRGKLETEDGNLYLWIEAQEIPDLLPQPFQRALLQEAVTDWQALKRKAVVYMRERILATPAHYGLDQDERRKDGGPDWLRASLDEYLHDFKLRQIGVPDQRVDAQQVYLGLETHMDIEHGCAVEMKAGQAVFDGMWADFGSMLILESESHSRLL